MSSVPLSKRSKSKVEFFNQAYRISENITNLLLKDFGIKKHSKDLKTFSYKAKMSEEDRENFINLCNKYHIDVEADYPLWLIEYYRDWILSSLRELIRNITIANTIYPTTENEFFYRRRFQWNAIGNCFDLLQAMQIILRILHKADLEKYMPYVKQISDELESLKAWKKADNRILNAIRERENK